MNKYSHSFISYYQYLQYIIKEHNISMGSKSSEEKHKDDNRNMMDSHRTISFVKCRKIAAIIREIQMYQNQPYSLKVEPTIRVSIIYIYAF
jgi:hypothetical protein